MALPLVREEARRWARAVPEVLRLATDLRGAGVMSRVERWEKKRRWWQREATTNIMGRRLRGRTILYVHVQDMETVEVAYDLFAQMLDDLGWRQQS